MKEPPIPILKNKLELSWFPLTDEWNWESGSRSIWELALGETWKNMLCLLLNITNILSQD
jgi:hypothetical protein